MAVGSADRLLAPGSRLRGPCPRECGAAVRARISRRSDRERVEGVQRVLSAVGITVGASEKQLQEGSFQQNQLNPLIRRLAYRTEKVCFY